MLLQLFYGKDIKLYLKAYKNRETDDFICKKIYKPTQELPTQELALSQFLGCYFPIQNLLKIFPSTSSVEICPVISPK